MQLIATSETDSQLTRPRMVFKRSVAVSRWFLSKGKFASPTVLQFRDRAPRSGALQGCSTIETRLHIIRCSPQLFHIGDRFAFHIGDRFAYGCSLPEAFKRGKGTTSRLLVRVGEVSEVRSHAGTEFERSQDCHQRRMITTFLHCSHLTVGHAV